MAMANTPCGFAGVWSPVSGEFGHGGAIATPRNLYYSHCIIKKQVHLLLEVGSQ